MIKGIGKVVTWIVVILLFLVGFSLSFLTIAEYRPSDEEVLSIESENTEKVELNQTLRLMSFNIGYAGLGAAEDFVMDGGTKGRPDSLEVVESYLLGITSLLQEHTSDIYLLQEVDLHARRSYHVNQVEKIHDVLGDAYAYHFAYNFKSIFVPFPVSFTDYIGGVESGLMMLSNREITSAKRLQFPGEFAWPLRVANLKRAMTVSRMPILGSEKELVVVNLHMSAYDSDGSMRNAEMQFLKEFLLMEQALDNYVVVGGDFNQTFPEAHDVYPVLDESFYMAYPIETDFLPVGFSFAVDITKPTCRLLNQPYNPEDPSTQYYIIDGFIVSSNITVERIEIVDHGFLYSDHNPVLLEIRLNP